MLLHIMNVVMRSQQVNDKCFIAVISPLDSAAVLPHLSFCIINVLPFKNTIFDVQEFPHTELFVFVSYFNVLNHSWSSFYVSTNFNTGLFQNVYSSSNVLILQVAI